MHWSTTSVWLLGLFSLGGCLQAMNAVGAVAYTIEEPFDYVDALSQQDRFDTICEQLSGEVREFEPDPSQGVVIFTPVSSDHERCLSLCTNLLNEGYAFVEIVRLEDNSLGRRLSWDDQPMTDVERISRPDASCRPEWHDPASMTCLERIFVSEITAVNEPVEYDGRRAPENWRSPRPLGVGDRFLNQRGTNISGAFEGMLNRQTGALNGEGWFQLAGNDRLGDVNILGRCPEIR